MTGDDSLALDSITSDYRFMLEHDVSMLEIALAAVSFEDCSLDDAVPLDRASVAYACLERLLLTVLFDGGSCRFIRSVVAAVNGYRRNHRG